MKILSRQTASNLNPYNIYNSFITLLTQLGRIHSFIGTTQTRQPIEPFDLNDVARAFDGSLALRFKHLGDQSED